VIATSFVTNLAEKRKVSAGFYGCYFTVLLQPDDYSSTLHSYPGKILGRYANQTTTNKNVKSKVSAVFHSRHSYGATTAVTAFRGFGVYPGEIVTPRIEPGSVAS